MVAECDDLASSFSREKEKLLAKRRALFTTHHTLKAITRTRVSSLSPFNISTVTRFDRRPTRLRVLSTASAVAHIQVNGKTFRQKKKPKKILKSTRSSPEKMASTMMPTCAGLSAPGRRRKGAPRRYTYTLPSLFLSVMKNTSRVAPARGFFSSNLFANLFSRENKQQKDC